MDKRFLIALALTAVVVIATPWLFGTQQPPEESVPPSPVPPTRSDSLLPTVEVPAATPMGRTDSTRAVTEHTVPDTAPAVVTRPETTVVSTSLANYQFTNIGAIPLSVELKPYKALNGSNQNVRLASASGNLLAYKLFLPVDTVDLRRTSFRGERSRSSTGADRTDISWFGKWRRAHNPIYLRPRQLPCAGYGGTEASLEPWRFHCA